MHEKYKQALMVEEITKIAEKFFKHLNDSYRMKRLHV